jgi:hypothetical protein
MERFGLQHYNVAMFESVVGMNVGMRQKSHVAAFDGGATKRDFG